MSSKQIEEIIKSLNELKEGSWDLSIYDIVPELVKELSRLAEIVKDLQDNK